MREIEVWGGVECSVNRVGERWHDQLELSGHAHRLSDLDLIAALGIKTLRYPVLWERIAPDTPNTRNWQWADERLPRLRALSIMPIVGLVHHGSGPRYTSLLEPNFAEELARFAGDVAARFPWVEQYTPINEPVTTARFSTLYGLWYPHHHNDRSFARAIVNQCKATVLSMTAIRRINPSAALVQTEDLGTTRSTDHMAYQRDFDNERRWLTWDLLCGRVNREHAMRGFLEYCGIAAIELDWFEAHPCPPQVIGINHYVTSDRYLDERLDFYPPASHGNNGREQFADAEAVRVLPGKYQGWDVIRQAFARYALPIAVTEVHIGCTREEQLRWLDEALAAAEAARRDGCAVIAVAVWALFGSYNWDKLLTEGGSYEPGAFDTRSVPPRPTAIAKHIQALTAAGRPVEARFRSEGWWQLPDKILYGPARAGICAAERRDVQLRPLLLCGANGVLGREFKAACRRRNLRFVALSRNDLENSDLAAVESLCDESQPWAIVNAAGYVKVDAAERHPAQCFRDNVDGSRTLAAAANGRNIAYLTFSSDLVFDGRMGSPYTEGCGTAPLNVYGESKVAAETATLSYRSTLCVRTAAFFGAEDGSDVLTDALRALRDGGTYVALDDVTVSPTYVPDLVEACLDLLIDGCTGLVHLVNQGALTWSDFLLQGAKAAGVDTRYLRRSGLADLQLAARRPRYSALASDRVGVMPTLEDALHRYTHSSNARASEALRE